jgi:hypothetical protein
VPTFNRYTYKRSRQQRRQRRIELLCPVPCVGCVRYRCPQEQRDRLHRESLRAWSSGGAVPDCSDRESGYWEAIND